MKNIGFIGWALLSYALTSCSATGSIGYTPERKYSADELKEDVQVMEQTLKENHPSLYWYTSKEEVDASFQRTYARLTDSLNEIQFRTVIAETIFPIRCGHTSVRFSRNYYRYTDGLRMKTFPLIAKVIDDSSLVVTTNINRRDSFIRTGTTLRSINGLNARTIIDTLFPLVSIDGNAKNFSYQNISNNFSTYYNMRFGLQDKYNIVFVNDKGVEQQRTLDLYDPAKDTIRRRPVNFNAPPPQQQQQPPREQELSDKQRRLQRIRSFSIDSTGTYATLRISSFSTGLSKHFLKSSFRTLKKKNINHLVIDVRNNGGGLIKSSLYLTRLVCNEPFSFTDSIYAVTHKVRSEAKISRRFIFNLGLLFLNRNKNDSMYVFRLFHYKQYQPLPQHFTGKVYIVTGGYSFSATTLFASVVKGKENVTIVGEETGGGYYGNNGVFIPEMVLPNSKLRVRLPLYRIVNSKNYPKDGHGVIPDIEVKASAESIRQNKDPKMEKVINLIMQRKG
ncbi:MAG: S41 family peptidase [Lacibacter sp.]